MKINILIDDSLMIEAMKVTGLKTKKETIEKALQLLIHLNKQETICTTKGETA